MGSVMHRATFPVLAALLVAHSAAAQALRTPAEVRAAHQPSDTLILDRHGAVLHRIRSDATVRRGRWLGLDEVSPAMRHALVLSEDQQFYAHSGVDWRAVSAAAWANVWNTRTRGASTLTMQLAGLLDEDLKASQGSRSVGQKIGQAWTARQLEKSWRKDQILEAYLNRVPFRGELVGVDALTRTLFAKDASGLDAREAAIAVALIRGPNAPEGTVAQRACQIVQATTSARPDTDCESISLLTTAALRRQAFASSEGMAPHLARRALQTVQAQAGSARQATGSSASAETAPSPPPPREIRTTLDANVQTMALASLQRHLREIRARNVEDGAVVVLDKTSGEVLAWVGSSGQLSQAREVDGVTARRQPGSTLKPLLFAQAIEEQRLTAASLLEDAPTQIVTPTGLYAPQNYDSHYQGWVSVRTALAASLNIPAVRALAMVGPDAFADRLNALGLQLQQSGGHYGMSLALGSAEVTLLDLSNAYRSLGNGGMHSETSFLMRQATHTPTKSSSTAATSRALSRSAQAPKSPSPSPSPSPAAAAGASHQQTKRVLDAAAAFIVGDVLADPIARASTFGTASALATRSWTAVKTGTSKDMRDNWALGWSDRYVIGVWVGNASGEPMWNVSGVSGAAPVWADVMNQLHANRPSRAPTPPAGVVQQAIAYGPRSLQPGAQPIEVARQEWFVRGTEQAQFTVPAALLSDAVAAYPSGSARPARNAASASGAAQVTGAAPRSARVGATQQRSLRQHAGLAASGAASAAATRQADTVTPPAWWSASDGASPQPKAAHITAPPSGTIVALDPDMPPDNQRLQFKSDATGAQAAQLRWQINGRDMGKGPRLAWLPMPGRHTVKLVDASGQVLDETRIEVRGAGLLMQADGRTPIDPAQRPPVGAARTSQR